MRDGQGNGCGIPSQIGGRCYCPTEVDADECKFVKSGLSMDLACRMLFLSTAITTGPVVEFGTWSGHSTRCMSAGAGVRGIANRVHGCDFFEAGHDYVKLRWTKYWSSALNQKSSLLPIFRDLTTPFYPSITYHQGDCHKSVAVGLEFYSVLMALGFLESRQARGLVRVNFPCSRRMHPSPTAPFSLILSAFVWLFILFVC
jgi:hypothetical protein